MLRVRGLLVLAFSVASLVIPVTGARADLIRVGAGSSTCGGDRFTGRQFVSSRTDTAGNVFTLECVNRDYFEGKIFVKATGKTTPFGRCVFTDGQNWINYETNAQNVFTEIEWVNVNPDGFTRESVLEGIKNANRDPTDKWLKKVSAFLKLNKLDDDKHRMIYRFPFSPNVQEIDAFEDDSLVTLVSLTPDEADMAYLSDGFSPISFLEIDPDMRIPGLSLQAAEQEVPAPSTAWLFAVGLLSIIGYTTARHAVPRITSSSNFSRRPRITIVLVRAMTRRLPFGQSLVDRTLGNTPRKRLRVYAAWTALLTLMVAFLWSGSPSLAASPLPGSAPDFTLTLLDGRILSWADLRGKLVVVNFWWSQ